jgi:putative ABC transport system permease protein
MRSLIWHSIRLRRVQSLSLVLTVALSVAVLFAFVLVFSGVQRGVKTAGERGGAQFVLIPADAQSMLTDADILFTGAPATMYLNASLVNEAAQLAGVSRVSGQFYSQTLDESCCSALHPTRLIGFDPTTDFVIAPLLDERASTSASTSASTPASTPSASASASAPLQLSSDEIILGSKIKGFESGTGHIRGNPVRVRATLAPTGTDLDDSILVSIDTARAYSANLPGYEHFWEKYGEPINLVSAILVNAEEGSTTQVKSRLQALPGVKVIERTTAIDRARQQLQATFTVLLGAGVLMAIASLLQMFARFYTMTWDRRGEFALYRAVGATGGNLRTLVSGEALLLTCAGIALGLGAGTGLSLLLLRQLGDAAAFPFIAASPLFTTLSALCLTCVFLVMTIAAVAVPLARIARVDPSRAMQQMDIG